MNPNRAVEEEFFEVVLRTAHSVCGLQKPDWYLQARLDQILDDYRFLSIYIRDDFSARAIFILRSFTQISTDKRGSKAWASSIDGTRIWQTEG